MSLTKQGYYAIETARLYIRSLLFLVGLPSPKDFLFDMAELKLLQ